jgi:hypothetical protein
MRPPLLVPASCLDAAPAAITAATDSSLIADARIPNYGYHGEKICAALLR